MPDSRHPLPPPEPELAAPPRRGPEPIHWAWFALCAVRRRKWIAAAVFLGSLVAVAAAYRWITPVYRAEARVLAQRQQALPSAVRNTFEEAPARNAGDLIHRRENLIAIIRAANLLPEQGGALPGGRPAAAEVLHRLFGRGVVQDAQEDPLETWIAVLDRKLAVTVLDNTITISLDARDPQLAYDVVRRALDNFLEARQLLELTANDEVIAVLQSREAAARQELEAAVASARRRGFRAAGPGPARRGNPELARVASLLDSKQRALADVEGFRHRRLAEMQAQLDEARSRLSDRHPAVLNLRRDLDALGKDSDQVERLREDVRSVRKEHDDLVVRAGPLEPPGDPQPSEARDRLGDDDPRVQQARVQHEQIVARVAAAEAERDAARAAFKYRYSVIWPPQLPTEPVSPNPRKLFPLGLVAALLLTIAVSVAPDLLTGRIVQRWQVERVLRVAVLGETGRRS